MKCANNIPRSMQRAARKLFSICDEQEPVSVEYELRIAPGNILRTEFVVRVGSIGTGDGVLEMDESLGTALNVAIEKCQNRKSFRERQIQHLRKDASELGFELVKKGGAK